MLKIEKNLQMLQTMFSRMIIFVMIDHPQSQNLFKLFIIVCKVI